MSDRPAIEHRTAAMAEVRYPDRTIDLVAVPYNDWTPVEYQGRMIEERFAPGAFGKVHSHAQRRRIAVNLDHAPPNVGRVTALEDHPDGLHAQCFIGRGPDRDRVLDDAADGMLDASVGFGVYPQDQKWEGRERRTITKAFLDHIALTWTPAYTGARVLAVRSDPPPPAPAPRPATPNLDRIIAERLAAEYARIP